MRSSWPRRQRRSRSRPAERAGSSAQSTRRVALRRKEARLPHAGAGFPAPTCEIPGHPPAIALLVLEKSRFLAVGPLIQTGVPLALPGHEHQVFRATLLSIVLMLAVGQNASLLCQVWCHDATFATCPHHGSTTSPSVSANDTCSTVVVGAVTFVREDARRSAAVPDAQDALAVPRFRLPPSFTDFRPGFESGWRLPLEERPLILALRI